MLTRPDARKPGASPPRASTERPVRRVLVFTIVGLALLMMSVDSTIVATVLHVLQHGLHTTINWAGWTITAYALGFVLMLPVSGKLAQRYGKRRVFIASVAAFTTASFCCGLVDNIFVLIALRAVQAIGGAGFTPSATGIIVDHFGDQRDRAVSLFGSIFPVGAMIGPIFGGLIATYWSWRGVFFVNVPIGLAVALLAWRYVPHDRPHAPAPAQHTDIAGVALLGCCLLPGMLAVSYLGERGASPWTATFLVPMLVACAAGWGFFRHVRRAAAPFIAPRLIYGRGFGPVNLFNAIFGGVVSGTIVLVPLYATNRYGIGTLSAGTLLVAQGAAAIILSLLAALALRRTGHRPPMYLGGAIVVIGIALLALRPRLGLPPYAWLALGAFLVGAGGGLFNPASRNAGLQLAPEHSAMLAALRSLSRQVGSISMISIATAILAGASDPGVTQAWIYVAAAALLVLTSPMIARIPEHHGGW